MRFIRLAACSVIVIGSSLLGVAQAANGDASRMAELRAFNDKFTEAHLKMDLPAILGFWADDGVTLLPGMEAVRGKPAIQKFLQDAFSKMSGAKMLKQDDDFQDLEVSGDWASEWAITHQVIQPPDGKPQIDVWGKMLLVLHREKDGQWKVKREAWTGTN